MKYLVVLLALMITACGDKSDGGDDTQTVDLKQTCDPDSFIVSNWEDKDLNVLFLGNDCFGGTNDVCDLRFKYYKPVNGKVLIDVDATNGGACLTKGEHTCTAVHTNPGDTPNESLTIDCGRGQTIYFPEDA